MAKKRIIVQKYGGTSVADPGKIKHVAKRVKECKDRGYDVAVVVSALGKTTDALLNLAAEISSDPVERELDMLMSTGEQVSVALLAMALHEIGEEAISFTGAQVGIITDSSHTKARILDISTKRIKEQFAKGRIVIVAGFQGTDPDQEITTLGRGGSDVTAVALAKVLSAEVCEIYTDVKGVYTADPRTVKNARKLENISYDEMLEFASLGAQVMQARSIEVASKFNIPIHVRASFCDEQGTMICKEVKKMEDVLVRGVTVNKDEAKVTVCDVPDKPGEASRLFACLAKANINVDMIIQNVSRTRRTDISFTVPASDLKRTQEVVKEANKKIGAIDVKFDKDVAKLSVVGVGMRSHSGVAAKMFGALASEKINIDMISTSEIKISCVIRKKDAEAAVRVTHKAFGLNKKK
ncbi:MAG: aspartate kinase [Candidatus Omnitrophica bacterium]|nr:aspartate kinase [Candidatus Omnitrophota bacterium]MBU1851911.1 aspartate kinase [Candidatus Omnitrophota bacterium]